ncbi:MAG: hypothetical protein ABF665_16855, partial [Gluconacetobacter sp.]
PPCPCGLPRSAVAGGGRGGACNTGAGRAAGRPPLPPAPRRLARLTGFALLGTALWGLIRDEGNLLFALTTWTLSCGWALLAAALACTLRDNAPARPHAPGRTRARQNATDTVP